MAKSINFVAFNKFIIDMDKNNNVYLSMDGDYKDVKIGKNVDLNITDNSIDIKVKKSTEMLANSLKVYSKDILFLESNPRIKKVLKDYYDENKDSQKDIFVVESLSDIYIGESVHEMDLSSKALLEVNTNDISKTNQKEQLKAYETPSNMYDIVFSLMQKSELPAIINADSREILSGIKKDLVQKISSLKKEGLDNKAEIDIQNVLKNKDSKFLISSCLMASFNNTKRMAIESEPDSHQKQILDYMDKNYLEVMNKYREMGLATHPFTKFDEEKLKGIPKMPFLDLQAGSGSAILSSATNSKTSMVLQGTEYRTLSEMGMDDESVDERYQVATDKNFLLYKDDYKKTFQNGSLYKAVVNTPVYLNPPYNADNKIAKNSIDVLRHNQQFFGLFPTSMKSYIADNISGHVFEVSRELTGYTDPKTPESFLFIVGTRHDSNWLEEKNVGNNNLFAVNGFKQTNFFKGIEAKNVDDAVKEITVELNRNKKTFPFATVVQSMFDYYRGKEGKHRNHAIKDTLEYNFSKTNEFLSNSTRIKEAFDSKKEDIQKEFGSENMLKKEKVFPNVQLFKEDGKVERLTYYDAISNQGLLVAYRDNYPEILEVIEKIAKQEGNELNILKSNTALYNLSNPYMPDKKDRKTTENIGLMKNYYLPSSFSLESKKNKGHILNIILDVYKTAGKTLNSDTEDLLKVLISKSDRLITKHEQQIKEDKKILKEEVFVLVDADGIDIAKLDISKTDIYNSLEKLEYFDLKNYIELAELQPDKKAKVMENFMKHLENTSFTIGKFSGQDMNKNIFASLMQVFKVKKQQREGLVDSSKSSEKIHKIYVDFMKENKIDNFFASRVNFDDKISSKFTKVLEKNVLFMDLKRKDRVELIGNIFNAYNNSPLDFFEYKRASTEEHIDNLLKEKLENISGKDIKSLKTDIYNALSQDFVRKKGVFEAGLRISKMLVSNYGFAKYKKSVFEKEGKNFDYAELYDELYHKITTKTLGLMKHQHESPERFLEMSGEQKLDMMMWEMRAGKTLGFTHEMYLLAMNQESDGYLILESKNIDDISLQLLSHMPHLFASSNFYLTDSKLDNSLVAEDIAYNHLNMADYYPNLPNTLKPYFTGRGDMTKNEIQRYGYEFEELIEKVEKVDMSKEEMLEKYSNSKFLDILNICCMKDN